MISAETFSYTRVVEYELTRKAMKQLGRLQKSDRLRIYTALETTCDEWPQARNIRHVTGHEWLRLRVGDYRIFFTVTGKTLLVEEVKKRGEHTY